MNPPLDIPRITAKLSQADLLKLATSQDVSIELGTLVGGWRLLYLKDGSYVRPTCSSAKADHFMRKATQEAFQWGSNGYDGALVVLRPAGTDDRRIVFLKNL